MQYTANKPFSAVLIIQDDGIRYRFQEDHIFKDIRFAQVTAIKLKTDYSIFVRLILIPLGILSYSAILYLDGYSNIIILNLVLWGVLGGISLFQKQNYIVELHKGPLVAEVFITRNKKEAKQMKKEIESRR